MVRKGSYYSLLTLHDEVQSHYQLGNIGKPLHSMNLDEVQKNVSRSMDTPLKQQLSLGENLENFLAPAGPDGNGSNGHAFTVGTLVANANSYNY
ncbi:hypothetical protein JHK82_040230 [Glycine max]|nr:hypothetical protein JHK86_040429 [Glycine max]KAG4966038.1 hypothetical protein JHK85_041013 [Glycine max]KAG5111007.1 hypothetical protein JHK82_040230 [Glycine max]KAG5122299.1 hypothetical protein JHK84_040639 [Glycine max]